MDQYTGEGKSDFYALDTQEIPCASSEVTWKLTNGEMTNVPASHGQWGGYRTTKAVAWMMGVGPAWIARHKDQTTNPMSLAKAKAAALAMVRNKCGDYYVAHPIEHLNGLGARVEAASDAPAARRALK
jgi:hypothetical protein